MASATTKSALSRSRHPLRGRPTSGVLSPGTHPSSAVPALPLEGGFRLLLALSRLVLVIVVAILAGCSATPVGSLESTARIASPSAAAAPTAPPTAAVTAELTPEPTPAPPDEADVNITQEMMKTWKNSIDTIQFQIVIEVTNSGKGYTDLNSSDRSYTIYAKDDSVLETGDFTYTFPQILGPGETGYYIETGYFDDEVKSTKIVGKMEPSITFGEASGPADAYKVSKIKITGESYGDGLQVSGTVQNTTTEDATSGVVGVVFFDGSGALLGGLLDNTGISDLRAGQTKGFKTTYPGTAPLKPTQVKSHKAYAYDISYF